jgi:deoxyribonuclease-1
MLVLDPLVDAQIRGNRNSMIYHLSEGCPGYSQIGEQNRVLFESEQAALDAGYRKAGNCR